MLEWLEVLDTSPQSEKTALRFPGKNIVYQDEYLFIEGVDAIFNSELLPTPTANFGFSTSIVAPTFLATAFLLVYGEKGPVTGLAKHLNYLCVFKTFSTEFFYDNGANTTAFVAAGTVGQVFISNGTGAPSWTSTLNGITLRSSCCCWCTESCTSK